jgi:hypothetical protein
MDRSTLLPGIAKLAKAGEQAGFTVEQMISLLNAGLGAEGLLERTAQRLEQPSHWPRSLPLRAGLRDKDLMANPSVHVGNPSPDRVEDSTTE